MTFGLRNAPGTFQREADVILEKVKLTTALVYIDDGPSYTLERRRSTTNISEPFYLF